MEEKSVNKPKVGNKWLQVGIRQKCSQGTNQMVAKIRTLYKKYSCVIKPTQIKSNKINRTAVNTEKQNPRL